MLWPYGVNNTHDNYWTCGNLWTGPAVATHLGCYRAVPGSDGVTYLANSTFAQCKTSAASFGGAEGPAYFGLQDPVADGHGVARCVIVSNATSLTAMTAMGANYCQAEVDADGNKLGGKNVLAMYQHTACSGGSETVVIVNQGARCVPRYCDGWPHISAFMR